MTSTMTMKQEIHDTLNQDLKSGRIPARTVQFIRQFVDAVIKLRTERGLSMEMVKPIFLQYRQLILNQINNPHKFSPFHQRVREPENLTEFGKRFFATVIEKSDLSAYGLENANQILEQLDRSENVILLSNHQTEADPQAISLLLEDTPFAQFADDLIWVAGERVLTDPMGVPFSLGRNLLCIYSKKHMDGSLLEKAERKAHNVRAMRVALKMLNEGGHAILVAPSGGRDRPDDDGTIDVAKFDPGSVEMFRLLGRRAARPCHFYPLALATYTILPPPKSVGGEVGEERYSKGGEVQLNLGAEIGLEHYPGHDLEDKAERRERLAAYTWQLVRELYHALPLHNRRIS